MSKKWLPCELHCHTLHSDGSFTVAGLMETSRERHLSGICLTDHNTSSGYEETKTFSSPAVLRGIEWTTYFGHMLVLDCEKDVDWRDAVPDNIDEKMKEVHSYGGLVGMAHPFQLGTPICTGGHWDYNIKDFSLVDYMEIWSEGEPLMTPANQRAKKWWLSLLDKGYRIAPTFGRDWHRSDGNKLKGGCTYLLIDGEITPEKMKQAIKNGETQLSLGILMEITQKDSESFSVTFDKNRAELFKKEYTLTPKKIRVLTKGGSVAYEGDAQKSEISLITEENSYYIFELWGKVDGEENQLLALTAPLYT